MFEVVGVLPDVDPVDGGSASHKGGILVREGFDE